MNADDFTIVIEPGKHNFSAYVPDLPGCISTGMTEEETRVNIREAIVLHLKVMKDLGIPIPEMSSNPQIQIDE